MVPTHWTGMPRVRPCWLIAVVLAMFAATGCMPGGDSDRRSANVEDGQGPLSRSGPDDPDNLLRITGAEVNAAGHPVVTFEVKRPDGTPHTLLATWGNVSFTFAKLAPRTRYEAGHDWQNYLLRARSAGAAGEQILGAAALTVQGANTERVGLGADPEANARLEHLGDGVYRYTLALDVNAARITIPGLAQQITCVPNGAGNNLGDLCWHVDGTALPAGSRVVANGPTDADDEYVVDYDPGLTHRVAAFIDGLGTDDFARNTAANAWYDFVPDGSPIRVTRDIVTVESCNNCHERLAMHGQSRVETHLCVTCHNPGSLDANSGRSNDFKQMVHKIHRGATLPSVAQANIPYFLRNSDNFDWSGVKFPQAVHEGGVNSFGIDNCLKCHMGADSKAAVLKLAQDDATLVNRLKLAKVTKDGDLWRQRSVEACSSCHDDVVWWKGAAAERLPGMLGERYAAAPTAIDDLPEGDWRSKAHPGGTSGTGRWMGCASGSCHGDINTSLAGTPMALGDRGSKEIHRIHLGFTRVAIRSDLIETQIADASLGGDDGNGNSPLTVRMRVWDKAQNKALVHGTDANFAFQFVIGWKAQGEADYSQSSHDVWPGRTFDVTPDWSAAEGPDMDGYYTTVVNLPTAKLPASGTGTVATQNGFVVTSNAAPDPLRRGVVELFGTWGTETHHRKGQDQPYAPANSNLPVVRPLHVTKAFSIGGVPVEPRRVVVDAMETCRSCHLRFAKHGPTGRNNPQLCVMCHNPNNTDVSNAARQGRLGEYDGKKEESKDFKRMIHAIHASSRREQGYQLRSTAFGVKTRLDEKTLTTDTLTARNSHFPTGRSVGNCATCHVKTGPEEDAPYTFELSVLPDTLMGSTVSTGAHPAGDVPPAGGTYPGLAADMNVLANHTKFSPIMSVCTSCHDSEKVRMHTQNMGASEQADFANPDPLGEMCRGCHGPGGPRDIRVIHPVK